MASITDPGLLFEIWTFPSTGSFTRKKPISRYVAGYTINDRFNDLSDGSMQLASSYPWSDETLYLDPANHANDKGSVLRVLRGITPVAHLVVHDMAIPIDVKAPYIDLALVGSEYFLDKMTVLNYDYPRSPSINSEHLYGAESVIDDLAGEVATEIQTIHRDSTVTSGNFTIDFAGQVTASLAWDVSASAMRTALENLPNITQVDVEGTGSQFAPWTITFIDPGGDVAQVTIGTSTLNGNLYVTTLTSGGTISPRPWHPSYHPVTQLQHGGLAEFSIVTSPINSVNTGATISLKIDAIAPQYPTDYGGGQILIKVNDGGEYRAGLWVNSATTQIVRFVIRDMSENFIAAVEMTLTANTWTLMEIPFVQIPLGVDQIIYRVAAITSGDPGALYVDIENAIFAPGKIASTIGVIFNDIVDQLQTFFTETNWFFRTWTDTHDSDGVLWDEVRAWLIQDDQSLFQLIEHARQWQYRFSFDWSVANSRWEWGLYNPGGGTTTATGVGLLTRGGVIETGKISRRVPAATIVFADGQEGVWSGDNNAVLTTAWGPLMVGSKQDQALDELGLLDLAQKMIADGLTVSDGVVLNTQNPEYLPWTHYRKGQNVQVDLGPNRPNKQMTVMALVATKEAAKGAIKYATHLDAIVRTGESALVESVRQLKRARKADQFKPRTEALIDPSMLDIQGGNLNVYSLPGQLFVVAGRLPLQFDWYGAIIGVRVRVNVAPTGASAIFDIHKNGVTIFTTQSLRPTIAATALTSQLAVPENRIFEPGDFYTLDVDQVGSTLPGGDATVMLLWKETEASVY